MKPNEPTINGQSMNQGILTRAVLALRSMILLLILAALPVEAQSLYSNAVMSLNPVAYWPLQETNPAPAYDVETNLGWLGPVANMYYASTNVWHGQVGAITGDSSPCARFVGANNSFAIVPITDNRVCLATNQPFTVELWTMTESSSGLAYRGMIDHVGMGNNAGGLNGVNASSGWDLNFGFAQYRGTGSANSCPAWSFHVFNSHAFTGGAEVEDVNTNGWLSGASQQSGYSNVWVYMACVFDGTNAWMYVYSTNLSDAYSGTNGMILNFPITTDAGAPVGGPPTLLTNTGFSPDTWNPIQLGGDRGLGANQYPGYIDEVAIYTNALTLNQITNHYQVGINGSANYAATILADNPMCYWRMDSPNWTPIIANTSPTAANYGSGASSMTNLNTGVTGANCAVYQPGTIPGVPGPTFAGFGPFTNACGFSGMAGAVDAGASPLLDPTGATNNFTLVAWFRGNQMESGRTHAIATHNANSWRASIQTGATTGTKGVGGAATIPLASFNANDGDWHMVVLRSTYVSGLTTNTTISLDGGAVSVVVVNPSALPGTNADVWLGGAQNFSQPTNESTYLAAQQYLSGKLCHVAYFNYALSDAQITSLYSAARPEPNIGGQPASGVAGVGSAYTNTVRATGTQLAYQWFKDNAPVATQTNANFVLASVQVSDASTNYFVVVTNIYGSVTSSVVSLTVVSNLTIVAQYPDAHTPAIALYGGQVVGGTNFLGSTPTFSVTAAGAVPISYQWMTNGVAVGWATTPSFTITNCQLTDATNVLCVLTNIYGSITSTVWSVSYVAAPMAPYPQLVLAGHPIGYWRLNEQDDGAFDGNPGAICNDYQSANNGIYTNVDLHNAKEGTGYSPTTDPDEAAAEFGVFPNTSAINNDAFYINNIDLSAPAGGDGKFTVALWANGYGYAQPGNAGLVTKGYFNAEEFTVDEGSTVASTGVRFYVRDAQANGYDASSSLVLSSADKKWHFIVGVCDAANGGTTLYIDGAPAAHAAMPAGAGIVNSAAVPVMIGARAGSATSGGNNQFRGLMNDVAIYNYALSASQIASQYQAVVGPIAPYFVPPVPTSTNISAVAGTTLSIPMTAFGTPAIGYSWTDVTTGGPLSAGATNGFTLNAGLSYANIPLAWNGNQLELSVTNAYGTTNVFFMLTVTPSTTRPNIAFSVAGGNQMTLAWPADHTGWRLQSQTNSLTIGVSTNWVDVTGSAATNQVVMPVDVNNGSVFYRLIYP